MSYAIIGLLSVLVLVFAIMSAKNWHWVNIVFLILTYLMGVAASIGLAQSLKLRYDATKKLDRAEKALAKAEKEAQEVISGPADLPEFAPNSLRAISEELERELYGRGRTWTSAALEIKDNNRIFKFPAARNLDDEISKLDRKVVFAFVHASDAEGTSYPFAYVATFRVIDETEDQVELEPVFIANQGLYDTINEQVVWTLFEKMPIDRRNAFKVVENISEKDFNIADYRAIVEERLKPDALQLDLNVPEEAIEYERIIDSFTFDGLRIGTINDYIDTVEGRESENFEAAPEEIFVEFRFTKNTDATFAVDATANLGGDGNFTDQGLASNPALQAGGKVGFKEKDIVLIDKLSAEAFKNANPVEEIDEVYIRSLNNYPYILENLQVQTRKMADERARVQKDVADTTVALEQANDQIKERTDIRNKLRTDLEKFQNDRDVINALLARRTAQLEECENRIRELRAQLDTLYRQKNGGAATLKP